MSIKLKYSHRPSDYSSDDRSFCASASLPDAKMRACTLRTSKCVYRFRVGFGGVISNFRKMDSHGCTCNKAWPWICWSIDLRISKFSAASNQGVCARDVKRPCDRWEFVGWTMHYHKWGIGIRRFAIVYEVACNPCTLRVDCFRPSLDTFSRLRHSSASASQIRVYRKWAIFSAARSWNRTVTKGKTNHKMTTREAFLARDSILPIRFCARDIDICRMDPSCGHPPSGLQTMTSGGTPPNKVYRCICVRHARGYNGTKSMRPSGKKPYKYCSSIGWTSSPI